MYCRNCGNKREEEDIFCTFCGNRVGTEKKRPLIDLKNMPKKTKKALFVLLFLLVLIFIGKSTYNAYLSEEAFIKKYIKAYESGDYEKIIKLSGIENNDFINKKNIKEKYEDKKNKKIIIKNITENSNKKGEYNRTVTYIVDGFKRSNTLTLKQEGQKLYIFKDYIITSNDFIAKDVSFTVPKDTIITIDNVILNEKYIEKKEGDKVTYKVDKLLRKNVKINIELENKITLYDIRSVFTNEEIDYTELNYNIIEKNKNTVEEKIKEDISTLINNSLQNKDFIELQNTKQFTNEIMENTLFSENYNKIKDKYQGQVNNFKIENLELNNIRINKENKITIRVKFDYSYEREEKGKRKNSRVVNITFDNKMKIEDFTTNNLLYMF